MPVIPRRTDDEQGAAMVIAVIVILILTTLSMALLGRTMSVMSSTVRSQQYDSALAIADAGLSDALFRVEQGGTPAIWEATGLAGSGSYVYKAERLSDSEYLVTSVGIRKTVKRAIQAKLFRSVRYPYALFSYQNLTLNGNSGPLGSGPFAGLNYYSYTLLDSPSPEPVRLGSNGQIVCNGGIDPTVQLTSGAGITNQTQCAGANWSPLKQLQPMTEVEAPPGEGTGTTQDCPTLGIFTGVIDGKGGKSFVCRQPVSMTGVIGVINPPFVLTMPDHFADGTPFTTSLGTKTCNGAPLDLSLAIINAGSRARNVVINKGGDCPLLMATKTSLTGVASADITFSGVLYAPESTIEVNGGAWWTGSIMANAIQVNGAPNFIIGYDNDLGTFLGKDWRVRRYGEIPWTSVQFSISPATS
jgi:hypothetical protein